MPRFNHAMAFDSARGELVLFGGSTFDESARGDTWVWDGSRWAQKFPVNRPASSYAHAMAYDAARGQVVMFGGSDGTQQQGETWVWDGTNWINKQPVTSPPAQSHHTMAYDAIRRQVVLFGASDASSATWTWDGANWTKKVSANRPSGLLDAAMAYDSARGQVVLLGSTDGPNETWTWNGSDWTKKSPLNSPSPRDFHALASDTARGQVVLFGGAFSAWAATYADTWVWDGTNWTEKSPATSPLDRAFHAMAYDEVRGNVVLFGGVMSPEETWLWNGTTWTGKQTANSPPLRFGHSMTYDAARSQVVLFGGESASVGNSYLNDTWVWNGSDWTEKNTANSPSIRRSAAMACNVGTGQVLLFGGISAGNQQGDSWVWDGVNWTLKNPANSPSPRDGHTMAYDSVRRQVLLFGGRGKDGRLLSDTWAWDGTNWSQKQPAHSPPDRSNHAMAYDTARGQVVLFGGGDYRSDTWVWDGVDWTEKQPANVPPGLQSYSMAEEGIRGRLILFGGTAPATWTWDGTDWTAQESPIDSPRGEVSQAMAYDAARGQVVLFGSGPLARNGPWDTWVSTGGGVACAFESSAAGAGIPFTAFSGAFTSTRSSVDCLWSATMTRNSWLKFTNFGGFETGVGNTGGTTWRIAYEAAANPTTVERTATISVGGKVYTVTQAGLPICVYELSAASAAIPATASTGSFTLTRSSEICGWRAGANSAGWLEFKVGTGSGNTWPFTFNAAANPTTVERTGWITIVGSVNGSTVSLGEKVFTVKQAGLAAVTLSVNRTALAFGAARNAMTRTPAQEVFVGMTSGGNSWTAVSDSPWLQVTPANGQGSGEFSVSVLPSASTPAGTYTGKITVNATDATNGPLVVNCTLTVKSTTTAPFGSYDTPVDGLTGVSGSIAVTGWALDDIGVKSVKIWRDPIGPELVHPNGYVYIGDAMFVAGARPDVEKKFPGTPNAYRAGWGYMMLTYGLPKANGTFRIHAIATDEEGNPVTLGTRTITVDNAHSVKPFGALDAPMPGETISGTFTNVGWALTPQPASIAASGSTIWVHINGVNVANPLYGFGRGDIATYFAGYANSNAAGGTYSLDSTKYANGMHAIAWVVSDNQGHTDGIGSRYFYTQNTIAAAGADPVERDYQLRSARLRRPAAVAASYPAFRRGYDRDSGLTAIRQAGEGLLEPVELKELDRVELHLAGGQQWTAALRVGDELRELPVGSTFDAEGGIFYWQLGAGFLGEYMLEFHAPDGTVLTVPVRVGME